MTANTWRAIYRSDDAGRIGPRAQLAQVAGPVLDRVPGYQARQPGIADDLGSALVFLLGVLDQRTGHELVEELAHGERKPPRLIFSNYGIGLLDPSQCLGLKVPRHEYFDGQSFDRLDS